MVSKDGAVKILDFGLAKLLSEQPDETSNVPTAHGDAGRAPCSARSATCRPSRRAASRSTSARTSSRSARSSTRWRRASAPSSAARRRRDADRHHPRGPRAGRAAQRRRAGAVPLDRRALPAEGPGGALRLDARPRPGRQERARAPLGGVRDRRVSGRPSSPVRRRRPLARLDRRSPLARRCGLRGGHAGCRSASARSTPAVLPADHVRARHDPLGALRPGRPDHRLQRGLGRRASKLFLKHPSSPDSLPLELPSANLLAISPSGEMAIAVDCRSNHPGVCRGTLARAALTGGAPRDVAEEIQDADWAPDGDSLLVVRDVAGKSRIEYPIGKVLYETSGHVSYARLSPQGGPRSPSSTTRSRRTTRARWRSSTSRASEDDAHRALGERARPRLVAVGRRGLVHGHRGRRQPLALRGDLAGRLRVVTRVPGGLKLHDIARERPGPAHPREPAGRDPGPPAGRREGARPVVPRLLLRRRHRARRARSSSSTRRAKPAAPTTRSTSASRTARRSSASARATRSRSPRTAAGRCR